MKPPLLSGTKPLPPLALFHPCIWGTASRSASLRSSWREAVAKSHELWPEVRPFQWGRYGKESTWTYCFWLVVSTYASEKWWSEFVSWDDEIMIIPFPINYGKVIIHSMVPVTTNQVSLDFTGKEYWPWGCGSGFFRWPKSHLQDPPGTGCTWM